MARCFERKWEVTADCHEVSSRGDENVSQLIVAMVTQSCGYVPKKNK